MAQTKAQLISGASSQSVTFNDATVSSINGGPIGGTRNRIINGGMDVWQRGTSFTPINNAITYGADRWFAFTTSGTGQARILQNGSVPAGFAYSLALGRQSGNTATAQQFICQCVESANILGLAGQQVTLSFYALRGANYSGGNLSVILSTGTTADQSSATFSGGPCTGYTGNTAVINTTQAITTSWVRYTFTGTVPSNALSLGIGIGYTPSGTAGADDNVYITGVQLEAGSVATPFERRSYSTEFDMCRRYCEVYANTNGTDAGIPQYFAGIDVSNRVETTLLYYPKRAAPSITVSDATKITWVTAANTAIVCSSFGGTPVGTTTNSANLFFGVSSGVTTNTLSAVGCIVFNAAASITVSAEL